jgi:hypothetical protein
VTKDTARQQKTEKDAQRGRLKKHEPATDTAHCAGMDKAETIIGKEEVGGSSPLDSSINNYSDRLPVGVIFNGFAMVSTPVPKQFTSRSLGSDQRFQV